MALLPQRLATEGGAREVTRVVAMVLGRSGTTQLRGLRIFRKPCHGFQDFVQKMLVGYRPRDRDGSDERANAHDGTRSCGALVLGLGARAANQVREPQIHL